MDSVSEDTTQTEPHSAPLLLLLGMHRQRRFLQIMASSAACTQKGMTVSCCESCKASLHLKVSCKERIKQL